MPWQDRWSVSENFQIGNELKQMTLPRESSWLTALHGDVDNLGSIALVWGRSPKGSDWEAAQSPSITLSFQLENDQIITSRIESLVCRVPPWISVRASPLLHPIPMLLQAILPNHPVVQKSGCLLMLSHGGSCRAAASSFQPGDTRLRFVLVMLSSSHRQSAKPQLWKVHLQSKQLTAVEYDGSNL